MRRNSRALLLGMVALFWLGTIAGAQQAQRRGGLGMIEDPSETKPPPLGDPGAEMMARNAIKLEEQMRTEALARVRESAALAAHLHEQYLLHQSLTQQDIKQLDRLEKIVKKARGAMGGEDDDGEIKDQPTNLQAALERLDKTATMLRDGLEKTPRQVVSAALIGCANDVLETVKIVRRQAAP